MTRPSDARPIALVLVATSGAMVRRSRLGRIMPRMAAQIVGNFRHTIMRYLLELMAGLSVLASYIEIPYRRRTNPQRARAGTGRLRQPCAVLQLPRDPLSPQSARLRRRATVGASSRENAEDRRHRRTSGR